MLRMAAVAAPFDRDLEADFERIALLIATARDHGVRLLALPEACSRQSPYPGDREMPRKYAHTFDLFAAVTAALTATSRLRVGSGARA